MRSLLITTGLLILCGQCTRNSFREETGFPTYTGQELRNIFYPLGGIGTGNLLIGGRGNILEMEIFNRVQRDELPPHMTFFSLWYRETGKDPEAMVLERKFFDNFTNGFGLPRQQLSGLPRFEEVSWTGAPPLVNLEFRDRRIPLEISLECFNPLIPLDVENSSLPLGEFNWVITNPGNQPVEFSLAFFISNPFKNLNYRNEKPGYPVRNSLLEHDGIYGLYMENLIAPEHPDFANMVVATDHDNGEIHTGLVAERWWDDAHLLWGGFQQEGRVPPQDDTLHVERNREVVSTLLVHGNLAPGETDTVSYYITWYVPNRVLESSQAFGAEPIMGYQTKNYYATKFEDARQVLTHYLESREPLKTLSTRYITRLSESTVPASILDAAASNLAILKSNLISRMENGDVHGFEGMGLDFGCCPGNCTHVWNYAQTLASLFPSLERNMRETAYLTQTFESGYQCFRTTFPTGSHHFRSIAADGQMGNIMRVYREWKFSGDSLWLDRLWPAVKRCLEYAWNGPQQASREGEWVRDYIPWDPERKGVLSGRQHNTYDIDFYGPNMLTGGLYLGALKACAEMADYLRDPQGELYRQVYESGRQAYDTQLWNGSWYVQQVEEGRDRYQYGEGCLADQLLGQYLAFNSGLGYILDPARVKRTLQSIYAHNYIPDFSEYHNVQRVYAVNEEGGVVLCSWPDGNRKLIPFPYADEVWTGVEYQVAASLIRIGLAEEGLEIVKAVRERYAGFNRNPYAEIESGFYYARALASWSPYLALSGFTYDGAAHTMKFHPAIHRDDFRTFWSCGTGWGSYRQSESVIELLLDYGKLTLKELSLALKDGVAPYRAELNDSEIGFTWDKAAHTLVFEQSQHLKPDDIISLSLK